MNSQGSNEFQSRVQQLNATTSTTNPRLPPHQESRKPNNAHQRHPSSRRSPTRRNSLQHNRYTAIHHSPRLIPIQRPHTILSASALLTPPTNLRKTHLIRLTSPKLTLIRRPIDKNNLFAKQREALRCDRGRYSHQHSCSTFSLPQRKWRGARTTIPAHKPDRPKGLAQANKKGSHQRLIHRRVPSRACIGRDIPRYSREGRRERRGAVYVCQAIGDAVYEWQAGDVGAVGVNGCVCCFLALYEGVRFCGCEG